MSKESSTRSTFEPSTAFQSLCTIFSTLSEATSVAASAPTPGLSTTMCEAKSFALTAVCFGQLSMLTSLVSGTAPAGALIRQPARSAGRHSTAATTELPVRPGSSAYTPPPISPPTTTTAATVHRTRLRLRFLTAGSTAGSPGVPTAIGP